MNVAVVDLSLQLGSGMEAISRLLARQPDLAILVFTMHQHAGYARQAFRAGAQGYLTKHADPDDMLAALRKVAQGGGCCRRTWPSCWPTTAWKPTPPSAG